MAPRRCPCRPGSVRRLLCLLLVLELARLCFTGGRAKLSDLLGPMVELLALLGGGHSHGYDHCAPHSLVTNLMAHKATQGAAAAAGPECGTVGNASHPAAAALAAVRPECVCAAVSLHKQMAGGCL